SADAWPPARVGVCVRAHQDSRPAHGAHLTHAARPPRRDRARQPRGAAQSVSSLLITADDGDERRGAPICPPTLPSPHRTPHHPPPTQSPPAPTHTAPPPTLPAT